MKRFGFCAKLIAVALFTASSQGASFPGNAYVKVADPASGLTVSGDNQFTIACWFKISVPSGVNITQDMTILANGLEAARYPYMLRYNSTLGQVEFVAKGSTGSFTYPLVNHPYLDRWYHVAVRRDGNEYRGFVDGREMAPQSISVGDTANANGLWVGGWENTKYFYGEIQEVAFFQLPVQGSAIRNIMYADLSGESSIKGYYKLGYTTNSLDRFKNFSPNPPADTLYGVAQGPGSANIAFEETDSEGEQSRYDSQKNKGDDAIVPLSGVFT